MTPDSKHEFFHSCSTVKFYLWTRQRVCCVLFQAHSDTWCRKETTTDANVIMRLHENSKSPERERVVGDHCPCDCSWGWLLHIHVLHLAVRWYEWAADTHLMFNMNNRYNSVDEIHLWFKHQENEIRGWEKERSRRLICEQQRNSFIRSLVWRRPTSFCTFHQKYF